MKLLAKLRSRHQPLARAVVALFAIGWLGLALQPCQAMYVGESGHGSHHEGMGHHSTPEQSHPSCPHCPSEGPDACETGVALDCETVGVPALPAKPVDVPAPDVFAWLVPAAMPAAGCAVCEAPPDRPDPGRDHAPSSSLQQRYCTYLK
jgi:hypothetical protein